VAIEWRRRTVNEATKNFCHNIALWKSLSIHDDWDLRPLLSVHSFNDKLKRINLKGTLGAFRKLFCADVVGSEFLLLH
jgi:hypothetical protein